MQKINRANDPNPFVPLAAQQVEITGDDKVGLARYGAGENMVVRRVFWDDVGDDVWSNGLCNRVRNLIRRVISALFQKNSSRRIRPTSFAIAREIKRS
jgi:hypothetical protein